MAIGHTKREKKGMSSSQSLTVQGEVIEQNFGEHENCFHTLDLYTAATLEHSLSPPTAPRLWPSATSGQRERKAA